ncbi:MAG: redox-sensing transcriptional repressor Rex [Spirochaetia bacterium]|nr:redox-sensing transcriptional repressor Rex [Spirochaetia bacterium]
MRNKKIVGAPSVRRLPSYLDIIRDYQQEREGVEYISGTRIARELDLESIQVRKDLTITGIVGRPKKGYRVDALVSAIERFLSWDTLQDTALVGAGNLGSAILGHREFALHGLNIVAAFDSNSRKIGTKVHGITIMSAAGMDIQIRNFGIKIAILTLPPEQAQDAADILVRAGIEGIWNFTTKKLAVPDTVAVQNEDLSSGFALLCVKMRTRK